MSLRLKLLLSMILLVVAGLAVSGVVTYRSTQGFLLDRVDEQLQTGAPFVAHQLFDTHEGQFGSGGGPPVSTLPGETYGLVTDTFGKVLAGPVWLSSYGSSHPAAPSLPKDPDTAAPFTTGSTGGSVRYRVLAQDGTVTGTDGTKTPARLIVAAPLTEVDGTLRHLLLVEAIVAGSVLLVLAGFSWWLVRREMRPLERMGETAGAIAQGDLTQRVADQNPRTEVGRLGLALNAMLSQIEVAFAERRASEDRLRRFLADASHELRTPLTSIRGYAELFRRGAGDRHEDLEKSMRRIEDESARMGVMVEDLLLLSRLDQGRPLELAPVDLAAVATDAVADARVADPARAIELHTPVSAPVVADEARLRQVAANLLSNALTHTPPGTPVTVRVAVTDGEAVLEVADQGSGLQPDQVAKVFEPFYRSDPSRDRATGGAGLGLAIVAAIADAHGGRVEVAETPGGGATFRVVLPLQPDGDEQAAEGAASVSSA